jgi:hypothetical protein
MNNEAEALTNEILGEPTTGEQQPTAPTLTLEVAGILPIDHANSDTQIGLLLMADGTVRWTQLHDTENGDD